MAIQNSNDADERQLAELGYKQELNRTWSGFSNFAISFSIISILAGCFTTFYFGWNNGGPIAISLGWPLIAVLILHVAGGVVGAVPVPRPLPDVAAHVVEAEAIAGE